MKSYIVVIVLGLSLFSLNACGVKPGQLSAPDKDNSTYPRTYPDLSTDPKP